MWAKGSSCDVPGLARSSTAFRLNGARGEPNATVVIAHAVRRTRSPGAIMRDIAQAMTMAGVRKGNRCGWIWDPVVRVTVALSELTSGRSLFFRAVCQALTSADVTHDDILLSPKVRRDR